MPESISKEAIKILKDDKYLKRLGKEARNSMIKFKNIIFHIFLSKFQLTLF